MTRSDFSFVLFPLLWNPIYTVPFKQKTTSSGLVVQKLGFLGSALWSQDQHRKEPPVIEHVLMPWEPFTNNLCDSRMNERPQFVLQTRKSRKLLFCFSLARLQSFRTVSDGVSRETLSNRELESNCIVMYGTVAYSSEWCLIVRYKRAIKKSGWKAVLTFCIQEVVSSHRKVLCFCNTFASRRPKQRAVRTQRQFHSTWLTSIYFLEKVHWTNANCDICELHSTLSAITSLLFCWQQGAQQCYIHFRISISNQPLVFDLRHSRHMTPGVHTLPVCAGSRNLFFFSLFSRGWKAGDEDYHSYLVDPASNICLSRRLSHASPE